MFAALSRPYKDDSAQATIDKIRNILQTHELSPETTFTGNPFPEIHSVSLTLPVDKGNFNVNGKGRTKKYCLASAYAELMERIQNRMYAFYSRTILTQLHREFGFYYDPREKLLSLEDFHKLPQDVTDDLIRYSGQSKNEFIKSYYECVDSNNMIGLVATPFYCHKTKKEVHLPLNLLMMVVGSNGMAAGNSYEEALYQALCEIMERWAAAQVFYNRLTPPTIPGSYLQQFPDECLIINKIEETGKYKVTIKDFSAGLAIPAVGIIIHNTQDNTYRLNVGCDTSFQIALSRCLTEVFQGYEGEKKLDQFLLEFPITEPQYFVNDDEDSLDVRYEVFANFIINGSGTFPPSLFGTEPSYQFDASAFKPRKSYKEEVDSLIEFFHSKGHTVYVQDVSYLGFPSLLAYIPEISTLGKKNAPLTQTTSTYDLIELDRLEPRILQIDYNSRQDCLDLASSLNKFPAYALIKDLVSVQLPDDSPESQINVSFLLTQLYFKLGKLEDAAEAFMVFQAGNPEELPYYQAMGKYFDLLASGQTAKEARAHVETELGQIDEVRQACNDLENHEEAFSRLPLPKCPNCSECRLNGTCKTKNLMDVSRTLYPVMKTFYAAQTETTE